MGNNNQPTTKKAYLIDRHVVSKVIHIPNSFPGNFQQILKAVTKLHNEISKHYLQDIIIQGIQQRFQYQSLGDIENPKMNKEEVSVYQIKAQNQNFWTNGNQTWHQLKNEQQFLKILKMCQYNHQIDKQLSKIKINELNSLSSFVKLTSIRQKINVNYTSSINFNLYLRLFLYYYLLVLKKCLSSKNQKIKNLVYDFYKHTGHSLLQFIRYHHLTENQLFILTYQMVYIQRHLQYDKISKQLKNITNLYQQKYLIKQYSLKIDEIQYNRIKKVAKCYLDQLYFCCGKEAEDPELGINQTHLPPLKGFPINRVKEKNRVS